MVAFDTGVEFTDEFIGEEEWQGAPAEDRPAFLFVGLQARTKFNAEVAKVRSDGTAIARLRRQYASEILAVAEQTEVGGLVSRAKAVSTNEAWAEFESSISSAFAQIRAEMRGQSLADTVELPRQTKITIAVHLDELRRKINASNLSDNLKERLHKRVDAFQRELDNRRTSMPTLWLLAGALTGMGWVSDAAGFVSVISDVSGLVMEQKAKEVQREQEMDAPRLVYEQPKQLEDHSGDADRIDRDA